MSSELSREVNDSTRIVEDLDEKVKTLIEDVNQFKI